MLVTKSHSCTFWYSSLCIFKKYLIEEGEYLAILCYIPLVTVPLWHKCRETNNYSNCPYNSTVCSCLRQFTYHSLSELHYGANLAACPLASMGCVDGVARQEVDYPVQWLRGVESFVVNQPRIVDPTIAICTASPELQFAFCWKS